ncbi:MAG TPA: hypothetical protein VGM82_23285 [Gemmatimonadaceae bacterium]|jgi:hypothetical protein
MALPDSSSKKPTSDEALNRLVSFVLGAARDLTPKVAADLEQRAGRTLTNGDEHALFLTLAFFSYHLVTLRAASVLTSQRQQFRHRFRDEFLSRYVTFALDENTPPADVDQARVDVGGQLDAFLAAFSSFSVPPGSKAMQPGSMPWELGRRIADELNLGSDGKMAEPGFIAAMASMNQTDRIDGLLAADAVD